MKNEKLNNATGCTVRRVLLIAWLVACVAVCVYMFVRYAIDINLALDLIAQDKKPIFVENMGQAWVDEQLHTLHIVIMRSCLSMVFLVLVLASLVALIVPKIIAAFRFQKRDNSPEEV